MEALEPFIPQLAALGGILVGAVVTWFMCRCKTQSLYARFEERSKAAHKAVVDLEACCANLEAEVRQLRHSEAVSLKRQSELEMLAKTQLRGLEEKEELLKEAERRMARNLQAVTSEALRATQHEFLQMARSSFDSQQKEALSEFEHRRVAVETLVRPVADTLNKVENRIGDLEKARKETEFVLGEHVRRMASAQAGLQKETSLLVQALRQPAGHGRWGEIQLKRVVELAGMQSYCDFQGPSASAQGPAGERPDLIVNLPTGRQIAVDSRAPLEAYLAAVEAESEEQRAEERKRYADAIGKHLAELASPAYQARCGTNPEFIVLFLPSESFLSAALAEEPGMLERGIERGVLFATPATLVVLLRAAAVGWRQEGIAEKARVVAEAGRELYSHVSDLAHHVVRVGQSLDATVQNYNTAIGSLEGCVLPGARKLSDLGVPTPSTQLPAVPEIGRVVRQARGDLSKLPLSGNMDSMAATGEVPDASFEGFTEPAVQNAREKLPYVRLTTKPKSVPEAAPSGASEPNADGAAGDLRAALAQQKKAG